MPEPEAISLSRTAEGEPVFDNVLVKIADEMRRYDRLKVEQAAIIEERQQHESVIGVFYDHQPLHEYPESIAYAALGAYIAGQKLVPIEKQLQRRDFVARIREKAGKLLGKMVYIESTDPKKYYLCTTKRNNYGGHDGLSQWHTSKKGVIEEVDYHPANGGNITLRGRNKKYFHTGSLIDRSADYRPAFIITEL